MRVGWALLGLNSGTCKGAAGSGMACMEARLTQANYALRLQASLKAEAERLAKAAGTTLNQFINVAAAEKIAALRTADFFRERMCPGRWHCSMVLAATRRRGRGMSWRGEQQKTVGVSATRAFSP